MSSSYYNSGTPGLVHTPRTGGSNPATRAHAQYAPSPSQAHDSTTGGNSAATQRQLDNASSGSGGGGATSNASRELLVLRDEIERNRSVIARLRHDVQAAAARDQAHMAANREHVAQMETELNEALGSIRRLTQHRDAPTVPREAQRNAEALLACRKEELVSVQRDIDVLERAIKQHAGDPRLRLVESMRETHPQLPAMLGLA